jgi:hypothetical protein
MVDRLRGVVGFRAAQWAVRKHLSALTFSAPSNCRQKVVETGVNRSPVEPWCNKIEIPQVLECIAGID